MRKWKKNIMKKDIFVYIGTTHKKRDKIRVRQHVNIVFLFAIGKNFVMFNVKKKQNYERDTNYFEESLHSLSR